MLSPPRVTRVSPDGLTTEKWRFCLCFDTQIILDEYRVLRLPTKRHKVPVLVAEYSRLRERDSTLTESQVPWPEDVREEALQKLLTQFQVVRWSEARR